MGCKACPSCGGSGSHTRWESRRAPPGSGGSTRIEYEVRTTCSTCKGLGTVFESDPWPENFATSVPASRAPKQTFFDWLAETAGKLVEVFPPSRGLTKIGERIMHLPGRYSARLAGIGAAIGFVFGLIHGQLRSIILSTIFGAVAGGMLLPAFGFGLQFITLLIAAVLILAMIVCSVVLLVYLITK
jgi:hypothetical protein